MPNYLRPIVPGGTLFFTVNLRVRESRLLVERISDLRSAFREVREDMPFETVAICVLPNHLHAVWALPEGDANFSIRWKRVKATFSRSIPKDADPAQGRRDGERGIWQRRFWEHVIRDERDLANHIAYTHYNPVKHGLVKDMDDWPYSSWHRWKRDNHFEMPPEGWSPKEP